MKENRIEKLEIENRGLKEEINALKLQIDRLREIRKGIDGWRLIEHDDTVVKTFPVTGEDIQISNDELLKMDWKAIHKLATDRRQRMF